MSTIHRTFKSINLEDVKFLNDEHCLYSIDFRATGEELFRDIDAMFKYENVTKWLGGIGEKAKRHISVNEKLADYDTSLLEVHVAQRILDASHVSIYDRLNEPDEEIKSIWVGVPHPSADKYAKQNNLNINYNYESFLIRNDKITQKKLFKGMTPAWHQFSSKDLLLDAIEKHPEAYMKKRLGAGGYSVFKLSDTPIVKILKQLESTDPSDWYIESPALGSPWSVQCISDLNGSITIFGANKQRIENDTIYCGAKIYDVNYLSPKVKDQLLKVIDLSQPILRDYVGFFGIDFMMEDDNVEVLELNVRLTSASIPTLLRNKLGLKTTAIFKEDVELSMLRENDVIFIEDDCHRLNDTLSFNHLPEIAVGYSSFIQLKEARNLMPQLDGSIMKDLEFIISKNVSKIISSSYHNFWPYGWTACVILAESHCVFSSWYEESNILVDVFCCNKFDNEKFASELAVYFRGTTIIDEMKERHLR